VRFWVDDREMAPDIAAAKALVQSSAFGPLAAVRLRA
jgi:hypothetical protein